MIKIEWQVVLNYGEDVLTFEKMTPAQKEYLTNPHATELRKVTWYPDNPNPEKADAEREDVTIAEKEAGVSLQPSETDNDAPTPKVVGIV